MFQLLRRNSACVSDFEKLCLPYDHDFVGLHDCRPSLSRASNPWSIPQENIAAAESPGGNAEEEAEKVGGLEMPLIPFRLTSIADNDVPAPRIVVNWIGEPTRTDILVRWLLEHPADCAILFYGKSERDYGCDKDYGPPSGKDRSEVYAAIARAIFEHDHQYASSYASLPDKFRDSVSSRISK
jgi:hypothetical protein